MNAVVKPESEHQRMPVTFRLFTLTRILMLLLLSGAYLFFDEGLAQWQKVYIIFAMCLFTVNHFSFPKFGFRYVLWFVALDFLLAAGFGVVFLGRGYPYEIYFGIIGVTLMLATDSKRVLTTAGAVLVVVWGAIVWAESHFVGKAHLLSTALNVGFVAFSCLVGSLIRFFMRSREKVGMLYEELEESHRALREYARQVELLTATRERNRIAREIHDTVGHTMTALLVQLQAARKLQARDPEQSREILERCEELARSALQQVRLSVQALREEEASRTTWLESMRNLLAEFSEMTGMAAELHVQGAVTHVPETLKPVIYRIVQESLTNAKRHGNASLAEVTVQASEREVRLLIRDDGEGADGVVPGFGLVNLRERVTEQGGTVLFTSQKGSGFKIEVCFPLHEQTWRFGGRQA
jgi:signal transduction histidine kinase